MIFPGPNPHVYALPPGADFPARLVDGLLLRLGEGPPERLGRVTVFLNTQRMRRRVTESLQARGATFLPKLRLVTELGADPLLAGTDKVASSLRRRLDLTVLIDRLLTAEPDLAPRSALFELADSLAALMEEMRAEAVSPDRVTGLDVSGHAGHWARTQRFVALVAQFFAPQSRPDVETRLRLATERQIRLWHDQPPSDPVIIAGSTGSRGTTALLMRATALLPTGAVVLPGFDFNQPPAVWASLADGMDSEDHPQFRYRRLMDALKIGPEDIHPWVDTPTIDQARNRLLSLSLRPAPVTDHWIADGPAIGDLSAATKSITLIEAPTQRQEALAIAICLRQAVEAGQKAALITPDRHLSRRVMAALDRWHLRPDDSAGQPLLHSPPGRLLRMTARAMGKRLTADQTLDLLKHPLSFIGSDRGIHLLLTRELELELRRRGPAFPDTGFLVAWAARQRPSEAAEWANALASVLDELALVEPAKMADLINQHRRLAEHLAQGTGCETGVLWEKAAGAEALAAITELAEEAPESLVLTPADYAAMVDGILARREVREAVVADNRIEILGPQEARIQGADLVILGGLNEGVWPARPTPDPWLNRAMRQRAGLLVPERRIGLSAHDYQMAAAAPQVVLSRARRDAEAETVAARWLNRLTNLLDGMPQTRGPEALRAMKAGGDRLLAQAQAVETPVTLPPVARPSPCPPVHLRPSRLSLTEIETLIRDPYAIYARHVLRLSPLMPLRPLADARMRGEVLHRVPEAFLRQPVPQDPDAAAELLMQITDRVLAQVVAWPGIRMVWRARMAAIARPFAKTVLADDATPVLLERKHEIAVPGLDFSLVGKPDRIDLMPDGTLRIVDYKSGQLPTKPQQDRFAKQLVLASVMAALGAFPEAGPHSSSRIVYLALKPGLKTVETEMTEAEVQKALSELCALIQAYRQPERGYASRRAMFETLYPGDYDDLARFGEWSMADMPRPEVLS